MTPATKSLSGAKVLTCLPGFLPSLSAQTRSTYMNSPSPVLRGRSFHTCKMIRYLWFSTSSPERKYPTPNNSPAYSSRPSPPPTMLQLVATPTFVQFMQKLLETMQVSQSVIVLSLHYIYHFKECNRFTPAQPRSEFWIAVAGLMMANKFLDE